MFLKSILQCGPNCSQHAILPVSSSHKFFLKLFIFDVLPSELLLKMQKHLFRLLYFFPHLMKWKHINSGWVDLSLGLHYCLMPLLYLTVYSPDLFHEIRDALLEYLVSVRIDNECSFNLLVSLGSTFDHILALLKLHNFCFNLFS